MSFTRCVWSVIVVSCLSISPSAKAALEKAAGKASTSVGLAHTAANAWALETDPAITASTADGPPLSSYFFLNGELANTYDASVFTLDTDANGFPTLQTSVSGLGGFQVTSFQVDYFANPNGNTDPGGGPIVIAARAGNPNTPALPSPRLTSRSTPMPMAICRTLTCRSAKLTILCSAWPHRPVPPSPWDTKARC